ncbi:MAG TPA: hypothetical protein VIR31_07340 [Nitrososphaeraceae archaeon]
MLLFLYPYNKKKKEGLDKRNIKHLSISNKKLDHDKEFRNTAVLRTAIKNSRTKANDPTTIKDK